MIKLFCNRVLGNTMFSITFEKRCNRKKRKLRKLLEPCEAILEELPMDDCIWDNGFCYFDYKTTQTDELRAYNILKDFYIGLSKIKPDKKLVIFGKRIYSYSSYLINTIPFYMAVRKGRYVLACHELLTINAYEDILQKRVYSNLMLVYRECMEEK